MGKSTVLDLFVQRGWPASDTDRIARELVSPGAPALNEVRAALGDDLIDSTGGLRRDALAAKVFNDEAARRQLEGILHPRIRAYWQAEAAGWRAAGHPAGVVDIPLLFETGAEVEFDAVICVACSPVVQRRRLAARGWDAVQAERRIAAQWPTATKLARSRFVLWNDGGLAVLADQVDRVLAVLGLPRPGPAANPS